MVSNWCEEPVTREIIEIMINSMLKIVISCYLCKKLKVCQSIFSLQVEEGFENNEVELVSEKLGGMQASLRLLQHAADYQVTGPRSQQC